MPNKIEAIIFLVVFGVVGTMDYQDEQQQQKDYCENVEAGVWSNYKNIDCGSSE